jgi:hypothetical protein
LSIGRQCGDRAPLPSLLLLLLLLLLLAVVLVLPFLLPAVRVLVVGLRCGRDWRSVGLALLLPVVVVAAAGAAVVLPAAGLLPLLSMPSVLRVSAAAASHTCFRSR